MIRYAKCALNGKCLKAHKIIQMSMNEFYGKHQLEFELISIVAVAS